MELLSILFEYAQGNLFGIFIALLVSYGIGTLWHGPLFGKRWMAYNGMKQPKKEDVKFSMMVPGLVANFFHVVTLCMVLGLLMELTSDSVWDAIGIATVLWIPFTALAFVNNYAWAGKKVGHMVLDIGYYLVSYWAIAAVLFATR